MKSVERMFGHYIVVGGFHFINPVVFKIRLCARTFRHFIVSHVCGYWGYVLGWQLIL